MKSTLFIRGGLLLSALILAGTAFAQDEPNPRRAETGEAPPIVDGGGSPWSFVSIAGQAHGSTLGDLTVAAGGGIYVWSMRREYWPTMTEASPFADQPMPRRIDPGIPDPTQGGPLPGLLPGGEGGFYPTPRREETGESDIPDNGGGDMAPVPGVMRSTLFYGDGATWTTALEVTGETGASVFTTHSGDVYASTDLPDGTVRVYRFHGGEWRMEELPAGVTGPAGEFAGRDRIYFRSGNALLKRSGGNGTNCDWTYEMMCDQLAAGGGLVYLGWNQIMVTCEGHEHVYNGTCWNVNFESLPTHVHGLWGARDDQGALHLYGAGTCAEHCFLRIFDFTETQPGKLVGQFHLDLEDPVPAQPWPGSYGTRVWGSQVHDVYLVGVARGMGQVYRHDGERWWSIAPQKNLPELRDVSGTPAGDLWISMADGRLLHRSAGAPTTLPVVEPPVPMPGFLPDLSVAASLTADLVVRSGSDGTAALEFSLPEERQVTLTMFDLAGRRVEVLRQDRLRAGVHQVTWNAARVPSGIYFCRLEAGPLQITRRVLVHR